MTTPRDAPCTACSFLLDRLEYALHLLDQVLEADKRQYRENSVRYLVHELEHLHGIAKVAREAIPKPPPMRLHVVPPDLLGGVDGDTGDGP